jgi:hypothetical protein
VPDGLTRRAQFFIGGHCVKVGSRRWRVGRHRDRWLEAGIPEPVIDRVAVYGERWGGLVVPPSPEYEGGPRFLHPDMPQCLDDEGWWFECGMQRFSVPWAFMIGPAGEFGIYGASNRWTPLHASIEGWLESLALTRHASTWAQQITKLRGDAVDTIALDGLEPVAEVTGLADTWWRGADSLVAVYAGEAECFSRPAFRRAYIYAGLDEWGRHGDDVISGRAGPRSSAGLPS